MAKLLAKFIWLVVYCINLSFEIGLEIFMFTMKVQRFFPMKLFRPKDESDAFWLF